MSDEDTCNVSPDSHEEIKAMDKEIGCQRVTRNSPQANKKHDTRASKILKKKCWNILRLAQRDTKQKDGTKLGQTDESQSASSAGQHTCQECKKNFKTLFTLSRHQLVHSISGKHSCEHPNCGKTFKVLSHLKSHQFSHVQDKAFVCSVQGCGRAYKTGANLKQHQEIHEAPHATFLCSEEACGKSFPSKRYLNRHKHRMHNSSRKAFPCPVGECERTCKSKAGLKDHMQTHSENKQLFKCNLCSKLLGSTQTLSRHHKRVHSEVRKHICATCGKGFKTIENLKIHEFCHTGARPFPCAVHGCGKTFVTKSNLKQHNYIHTGGKPFLCAECGVDFRSGTKLRDHKVTSHGAVLNTVIPVKHTEDCTLTVDDEPSDNRI